MPRVVSFIVLVGILLFIAAMFFKVMAQFVIPLFLAAVLVVVFKPLHMWVRDRLPGRLRISALVTTVLILLTVLLPMTILGWNAYLEGQAVFSYLRDTENRDELTGKLQGFLNASYAYVTATNGAGEEAAGDTDLPEAAGSAAEAADDTASESVGPKQPGEEAPIGPATKLNAAALYESAAGAIGGFLVDMFKGLLRTLIGLIIMVLALYYFLVDGPTMIHTMMRLSPLDNAYERELLDRFANVSRGVVVAVLASAVVQGVLAGAGFYVALPDNAPIFLLTMLTMVLAVVPFVGAAGVWIPTCLWIFFYKERLVDGAVVEGDPFTALALAAYCAGVVSTIDNVIKPLVLHGQSNLHPLLALMSVLGGVTVLGPVGILVGPMLVAFIHALLVMVNKELRLLSTGDTVDGYQKSLFPMNPATATEAEAAAASSGGFFSHLAASKADDEEGKPAGPIARVRNAAKRR
ncbi:MAG TPA: AI-2E family transporter, partial [Lacipirellula sp.]